MPSSASGRPVVPAVTGTEVVDHATALIEAGLQLTLLHVPKFGASLEPDAQYPQATGCTCNRSECTSQGKHPIWKEWQKRPLVDAVVARDAIAANAFTPNLGLVLGRQPSGAYILAIDVDDVNRVTELIAKHGELPETARCDSGRGYRLLFTLPDSVPRDRLTNITGLDGEKGVDVKCKGGQIVIAPSWHYSGVRYSWTQLGEIAELPPSWVLAILSKPTAPEWVNNYTPSTMKSDAQSQKKATRYLESAVTSESSLLARSGKGLRNNSLYTSLCRLLPLAHGLLLPAGHSYVVRELAGAAKAAGLSDKEIRTTVASAEKWLLESGASRIPFSLSETVTGDVPFIPERKTVVIVDEKPPFELIMDGEGPAKIATNVARLLSEHSDWRGGPRWDEFQERAIWPDPIPAPLQRLKRRSLIITDADEIAVQGWLLSMPPSIRVRVGIEAVHDGISQAARWASFDSLRERVEQLPTWDGEPRLDKWLQIFAGAKESDVTSMFGRRWLISAIARAYTPGCIADGVLVLEGKTGIGKNRLLTTIFGDAPWVKSIGSYKIGHDIEADQIADSSWVIHDDEMRARGSDLDALKSWISRREDTYRVKFGRNDKTVPRRAVLACSTERSQYLLDDTNRRFWPVACTTIDWRRAELEGPQLLSEARDAYKVGEPWTIQRTDPFWDGAELAQEQRKAVDPAVTAVVKAVQDMGKPRELTLYAVADRVGLRPDQITRSVEIRYGIVLRDLGYYRDRVQVDGVRTYVYRLT